MIKQNILSTGISGLLGSRIFELLHPTFEIADISQAGINICDHHAVDGFIATHPGTYILHLAAKTAVDVCEGEKTQGKESACWQINVEGTQNIVNSAKKWGKQVIYISTDFVFDGTKDWYSEADTPHPLNWYGITKYEGEKIVLEAGGNMVIRLAYPYMAKNSQKPDFLHTFIQTLQQNKKLQVVTDHYFTPTFVDDIVRALVALIANKFIGIVHVVGSTALTPYEAAGQIAQTFNLPKSLIIPTTMAVFYQNRAQRPLHLRLKNDTITSLGVDMKTLSEGLLEVKRQQAV